MGQDPLAETALLHLRAAGATLFVPSLSDANTALAAIAVDRAGNNQIAVGADANMRVQASDLHQVALTASDILLVQLEVGPRARRGARIYIYIYLCWFWKWRDSRSSLEDEKVVAVVTKLYLRSSYTVCLLFSEPLYY